MTERRLSHSPADRQLHSFYQRDKYTSRNPEAVLMQGLQALSLSSGYTLPLHAFPVITEALQERYEMQYGDGSNPEESMQHLWTLIAQTHDSHFARSIMPVSQVPTEIKRQGIESLVRESIAHVRLLHNSPSTELVVRDDLSLIIGYDSANWEGIGGIYVYLKDDKVQDPIPAFVMRGNPSFTDEGNRVFAIRAVQPWISDENPSVADAKREMEARKENALFRREHYGEASDNDITSADTVLQVIRDRKRLLNRLTNALKIPTKDVAPTLAFVTQMAMAYLRKQGITEFRGIAQSQHPEVVEYGNEMGGFNFDTFWPTVGFIKSGSDPLHPWVSAISAMGILPAGNEVQQQLIETIEIA